MARSADTYRAARRNQAKADRIVWRELPKRVGDRGKLFHGMASVRVNKGGEGTVRVLLDAYAREAVR